MIDRKWFFGESSLKRHNMKTCFLRVWEAAYSKFKIPGVEVISSPAPQNCSLPSREKTREDPRI